MRRKVLRVILRKFRAKLHKMKGAPFWGYRALRDKLKDGEGSWADLRQVANIISANPWIVRMDSYRNVLTSFDPDLRLPDLKEARFYGQGLAGDCLASYRRGELSGRRVFEKIYRNDSTALRKNLWFYQDVLPSMASRPHVPDLVKIAKGARLSALYFDFIDNFTPAPEAVLLEELSRFCTLAFENQVGQRVVPLLDFRNQEIYLNARKKLSELLVRSGRSVDDLEAIEHLISGAEFPKHLSHGDLSVFNVDRTGIIIDWDMCGYAPVGYDIAIVMHTMMTFTKISDVREFVDRYVPLYGPTIRLSLLYLAAILYCRKRPGARISDSLVLEMFDSAVAERAACQPGWLPA